MNQGGTQDKKDNINTQNMNFMDVQSNHSSRSFE